ncbi:MAG TPA: hypothetical protein VFM88_21275 [Vicinamibacteria bacterium]|nr:hypothetical protein [Vicinamibacteria bacterium]
MTIRTRGGEAGYAMAALLAAAAVMVIGLAAAAPSWRYVVQNDREEELLFRGGQIADGIQRYQKRNGGALPPSLDVLVKGRFLRKAYKDPMTKKGEWRLVRQGEAVAAGAPVRPGASPSPPPTTRPTGPVGGMQVVGGFVGVVSTSPEKSLRVFNGRQKYDEWTFVAGQARIVGRRPSAPGVPSPGVSPPPATTRRSP